MWLIAILVVMFVIMLLLHKLHSVELKQLAERVWELEDKVEMQADQAAEGSAADNNSREEK